VIFTEKNHQLLFASLLEFVVELSANRARLVGRIANQSRNIELEARVVGRQFRNFIGEIIHE
jgi:predicted transcriptional regulator